MPGRGYTPARANRGLGRADRSTLVHTPTVPHDPEDELPDTEDGTAHDRTLVNPSVGHADTLPIAERDPLAMTEAPPAAAAEIELLSFFEQLRSPGQGYARFEVGSLLGKGGMGRVLEVSDPALGRSVALKEALPGADSEERLARFVREARVTAQLEHPNIVPIYDAGIGPQGQPFYVMRKVEGRTLSDVIARDEEDWPLRRQLAAFIQVCNAVGYAHERGVLHRDLKPDNVILGRFGEVLLLDWGVARVAAGEATVAPVTTPGAPIPTGPASVSTMGSSQTLDGAAIGTPGYMSPEAARGDLASMSPASDVFSLGAML